MYRRTVRYRALLLILLFILLIWGILQLFSSSSHEAKLVVQEFYDYEKDGDFSDSWSLFHPLMQERFSKGNYIQDRAHVFMNHFGVTTFAYELGDVKKIKNWKVTKSSPPFKKAYQVNVIQTFKGKYGNFDIHQPVYVVEEKKKWKILWDYNQ